MSLIAAPALPLDGARGPCAHEHLVLGRLSRGRLYRAGGRSDQFQAARPRAEHARRDPAQLHLDRSLARFQPLVWKSKGDEAGLDFLTGYIIEYSLSVDNIFVFVLIFAYFRVPPRSQHRVLVWGILGALVMRGVMIWLGVTLVERFHFVLYIFGAFLVLTGLRMLFDRDAKMDFEKNFLMLLVPALASGHEGISWAPLCHPD